MGCCLESMGKAAVGQIDGLPASQKLALLGKGEGRSIMIYPIYHPLTPRLNHARMKPKLGYQLQSFFLSLFRTKQMEGNYAACS